MNNPAALLARIDPSLGNLDPNIVSLAAAALVFGFVMASARTIIGKANAIAIAAVMAYAAHLQNWTVLYAAMAYGVAAVVLGGRRRARA